MMNYLMCKYLLMNVGLNESDAIEKLDADIAAKNLPVVEMTDAEMMSVLSGERAEWVAMEGKHPEGKAAEMIAEIDSKIEALSK